MSDLVPTNGEEAVLWLKRAEDHLDTASYVAGKENWHMACHLLVVAVETAIKGICIANEAPAPRKHHIRSLLSHCPDSGLRQAVYRTFDRTALNDFSRYYFARYPDGEDADQGAYLWCSQVAEQIIALVKGAWP